MTVTLVMKIIRIHEMLTESPFSKEYEIHIRRELNINADALNQCRLHIPVPYKYVLYEAKT